MSATAVPLRPLDRGTVAKFWAGILLLILLGAGLAWLGTSSQQYTVTDSGLRYRVLEAGEGDAMTPNDLAQLDYEIRKADGTVLDSSARTGQAIPATVNSPFPGLREVMLQVRQGGVYQAFISAEKALGQPIPAGGPVAGNEVLEFRLRAGSILKGMAAMQQMMGQGGAQGPGGPGGPGPGPGGPPQ